ncbi:hypothetical protein DVR12_02240 [Chitinophaga silvatica]|uniref:DUF4843 domain-containing protein n=1 Tax=Chitinophaga silvatica TaxID=2282649 RepID=A0A3E1YGW5_9BACT|nr:putative zinc-binding metallopeptidase [Chitinophaga silvatica]RFS26629.1 hypothetical protein DVR12_02240 [Chitinophaga silvatica]
MKRYFILALAAIALSSCSKNETLTPSEPVHTYTLPQGNNAFDQDLVSLFNTTGTYFLYRFSRQDYAWKPVESSSIASAAGYNYSCENADPNYVPKMLEFIQQNWLSSYPDAFLKKTLPYKVILGANLKNTVSNKLQNTTPFYNGFIISNFSAVFDTMKNTTKVSFRGEIHKEYWNWILSKNLVSFPTSFTNVSNYTKTGVTAANMYSLGFIAPGVGSAAIPLNTDIINYIMAIISNSKTQLDDTILKPSNDVNGLIRAKYKALTDYFKSAYAIDLQEIGNNSLKP